MKLLLIMSLLLVLLPDQQDPAEEPAPVSVLSFKWFKDKQSPENVSPVASPAPAMIPQNKNFAKQVRINQPAGDRDPNLDTLDGRASALENAVQQSRQPDAINGFAYQVKMKSAAAKPIELIFWEYRFKETANPKNVTRRLFVCSAKLKPDKERDINVFTLSGPSDVIHVKSLAKGSGAQFEEAVVINRVEYADGTSWQRKDWNVEVVPANGAKDRAARNQPLCKGM